MEFEMHFHAKYSDFPPEEFSQPKLRKSLLANYLWVPPLAPESVEKITRSVSYKCLKSVNSQLIIISSIREIVLGM